MASYNPAEAPVTTGNGPTSAIEYDVTFAYSFYGSEKSRTWTFRSEKQARTKVAELLKSCGPEYVWLVRREETSLPLTEWSARGLSDKTKLACHHVAVA
jgi:hypothetical protein